MTGVAGGPPLVAGIIFDLDGTLGDTLPVCFAAFRRVFEMDHGVVYDDAEIRAMFGPTERGVLATRAVGDLDTLLASYLQLYTELHDAAAEPFDGVRNVLTRLAMRSIPTAVVTGKGLESAEVSLDHWGLRECFTQIRAGSDHGDVKVENMRAVVTGWGIDPAAVVAVGDVPLDVSRARQAGVRPVAAAWATTADRCALAASEPEAVFDEVGQFWAWLEPQLAT